jgi:hypothetical protein
VDVITVQLCTEEDITPLISRALDDEEIQIDDPLRGWEGGQVISVPVNGELAGVSDEHDMQDRRIQDHLDDVDATNVDQANPQIKTSSHKQKGKRARCRRKKLAQDASMCQTKAKLAKKHLATSTSIATTLSVDQLHIAQGAYVGKRVQDYSEVQELDSLLQQGFKLVRWDGR